MDTKKDPTALVAARAYVKAGLSVIPVKGDASKQPALRQGERKRYEENLATEDELRGWFGKSNLGIAILGGKISGNLECLDFDDHALENFPEFCSIIQVERPGLMERLVVNKTPRPGYHVVYRVDSQVSGSTKLATVPWLNPDTQREQPKVMIETRGDGGYFIVPGSPPCAHENNRPYEWHSGPRLSCVQTITMAERETLLAYARSFSRTVAEFKSKATPARQGLRPGEDFDKRGPDWAEILEPVGWIMEHQRGDARYWRRPGKTDGVSATTGVCKGEDGCDLMHVFSSNAHPLESEQSYGKFNVYVMLHHAGDYSAAAKKLGEDGYGEQRPAKPLPDPLQVIADDIKREAHRLKPANKKECLEALEEIGMRVMRGIDLIERP